MEFQWLPGEPPPEIEEHSTAKLAVLRGYLHAYFNRLNVNPHREEFRLDLVDGFAGGGTFLDRGETTPGSPLVMLEESSSAAARLNLTRSKPLHFDCKHYFVDKEPAHVDHLRKVLLERGYVPDDERIVIRNCPFAEAVDGILAELRRRQPGAGRAIFLLDQTGYAQVKLELVARILRELPAAEVILTFATDNLVNYLSDATALVKSVAPLESGLATSMIHRTGFRAGSPTSWTSSSATTCESTRMPASESDAEEAWGDSLRLDPNEVDTQSGYADQPERQ